MHIETMFEELMKLKDNPHNNRLSPYQEHMLKSTKKCYIKLGRSYCHIAYMTHIIKELTKKGD